MLTLIILALASFAITWTITSEDGPGNIFEKMRNKLRPILGYGVDCPICTGLYVSALVYTLYRVLPLWSIHAAIVFALHGFIILVIVFFSRMH